MSGLPALLAMLDLQRLPEWSESDRKAAARSESGTVIHEVGHFLAAKFGLPMDFIVFDWSSEQARMHAAYLHPRYTEMVEANQNVRLGLLAAGYAAEMQVFGVGLLNRAVSDLEAAAELLGFNDFDLDRDALRVTALLQEHDPFDADDAGLLVDMHNAVAALVNAQGGPNEIFVIPNYQIAKRFRRPVPFWRRIRSAQASKSVKYARAVCDRLLSGDVRSGV